MNDFNLHAVCESGHAQTIRYQSADIAWVEGMAGLMDGTSDWYKYPPPRGKGKPGEIGKCGICGDQIKCTVQVAVRSEGTVTLSGKPPNPDYAGPAPQPIDPKTGMHGDYYVLSEHERSKGFVRPVRQSYIHEKCGGTTKMGLAIAETYARDPKYYTATFCCHCGQHFPVGESGEFKWPDGSKVGT